MVDKIPILNKILHTFKILDDMEDDYSVNIIEYIMLAQLYNCVSQLQLMKDHFKHKSDIIESTIIKLVTKKNLHGVVIGGTTSTCN